MKLKGLPIFAAGVMFLSSFMVSCLDNDTTVTYSSEASITSFSLGTLKYTVHGKDSQGNDSLYTDTVAMGDYPFTINHRTHSIENKDSLPVGTDISKVITKISADTPYIFYGKITKKGGEAKDTLWTNTDSIDFSVAPDEGLSFKVLSYNNTVGAVYHVKVNVHQQDPDSLQWTSSPIGTPFASGDLKRQKAVFAGQLYVFGLTQSGEAVVEHTSVSADGKPGSWTADALPTETDTYSAFACNGKVYFLAANKLYELGDGVSTEVSGTPSNLTALIGGAALSDKTLLYAQTSDNKQTTCTVASDVTWSEAVAEGSVFSTDTRLSCVTIPVSYNQSLKKTVVAGYNASEPKEFGIVASRLTNDDEWTFYDYAKVDTFECPNVVQPTMIYYYKKLYLFGSSVTSSDYTDYKEPFSTMFCSTDNGLTWQPTIAKTTFATGKGNKTFAEIYAEKGSDYSCTVDDNHFIWMIWQDGTMTRGRINYYGFTPKQW